jgi:formylglycine-generating enzyme required for sulfatase activity/WD40 repeat protein
MEFVLVPKGRSWLNGGGGTQHNAFGWNWEPGDKEVEITGDFYLGRYEVTQEEWEKVMGTKPSFFSRVAGGKDAVKDIPEADLKRFPVERVSWDDAQLFLRKLNDKGKEAGWLYRLPKEVEWEYACRGGPLSNRSEGAYDFYLDKRTNQLQVEQANFGPWGAPDKGLKRTCKVGSFKPNALGLFDMHGNVWEWCEDEAKDEKGVWRRVLRGGSLDVDSLVCRAATRNAYPPSVRFYSLGLRVARVPAGKEIAIVRVPAVKAAIPPDLIAYLSDLKEFDYKGHGAFGKNGKVVDPDYLITILVNGARSPKGLWTHPLDKGEARVRYNLEGLNAHALKTKVAINDNLEKGSATPLLFQVLGDGKVLWESKPIKASGETQDCSANVQGVRLLELRVNCPGWFGHGNAVWLDPYLASGEARKAPKEQGFVPLFNGKDLTGWVVDGGEEDAWQVKNGELVVHAAAEDRNKHQGYLLTARDYRDFRLRFQFQRTSDSAVSGIALRAVPRETARDSLPDINVKDDFPFHLTVSLRKFGEDERTGNLWWSVHTGIQPPLSPEQPAQVKPSGEWNDMEIEMRGQALRINVNGREVQNVMLNKIRPLKYPAPGLSRSSGRIGFWKRGGEVRFRNIEIKELAPAKTQADGPIDPNLRRAYMNRGGVWKIEGDEIVQEDTLGDCQLVFGDFTWKDYDFTVEANKVAASSEIVLLYHTTGSGYGLFCVPGKRHGNIEFVSSVERGIHIHLKRSTATWDPNRWYKLGIRLRGPRCQCFRDGELVLDLEEKRNPQGAVGLWTSYGAVRFRNIRVTDPAGKVLFHGLPQLPASAGQWLPASAPASANELQCLKGHNCPVTGVSFSPDGRQVLSSSDGETLGWNVRQGPVRWYHPASSIRLWDAATGKELDSASVGGARGFVKLARASAAPLFVTHMRDHTEARLWSAAGGKIQSLSSLPGSGLAPPGPGFNGNGVLNLGFTPDGRRVRGVQENTGRVWEWDVADRILLRQFPGIVGDVTCTALTPDATRALLARRNQPFAEIDLDTGKETGRWQILAAGGIRSIAISPDGKRLVTGGEDGTIRLWDMTAAKHLAIVGIHPRPVLAVAISSDGRRALSGGEDEMVRLWDLDSKKEIACFTGHTGAVRAVAFSPDGLRAASGSADYTLRLWRLPGRFEPGK